MVSFKNDILEGTVNVIFNRKLSISHEFFNIKNIS